MRVHAKTLQKIAGFVWIAIGIMLMTRGMMMMLRSQSSTSAGIVTSLLVATVIGGLKGTYVLARTSRRNIRRIKKLAAPRVWNVFSLQFAFVIFLMIGLGKLLRRAAELGWLGGATGVGGIYVGIGLALVVAASCYFAKPKKPLPTRTEKRPIFKTAPIGILLVNLGTPDGPDVGSVRRYLREFLSDERVIEVNRAVWAFVLHVIILPFRSPKSAAMYRKIWTNDYGSPLLHFSQNTQRSLQKKLGNHFHVALGMRYGAPSLTTALSELRREGCRTIKLLPLFPQYSNTTVGTVQARVSELVGKERNQPTLQFLPSYSDHAGYIQALADLAARAASNKAIDLRIFSFHGMPEVYLKSGDPYLEECTRTAWCLADALGLERDEWEMVFQSRFGDEPWLQPYLDEFTIGIAQEKPTVQVIMPGFATDCLETLEEVGMSLRDEFIANGGRELIVTPALNDNPLWIEALHDLVLKHTPEISPVENS